jgi:AcrR family transcriptional regulator
VDSEPNTQQIILEAALREFHQNGFKGARTGRIAEAAGISRTMLHYYFSTKEALFEAVLNKTFGAVMPHLHRMAAEEQDVFKIIENLVDAVADMLEESPGLPSFVVNILNENPQLILNLTAFQNENTPGLLDSILAKARAEKSIRPEVQGEDLLLHVWGLCSTPYLLAPYISVKEKRDEAGMRAFIQRRREIIKLLIFNGIKT